jgi:hypothetical protein
VDFGADPEFLSKSYLLSTSVVQMETIESLALSISLDPYGSFNDYEEK